MPHPLSFLRRACNAAWASAPQEDLVITELATDTRSIAEPPSALFAALPGSHRAGQAFVSEAYGKGVRAFLLSEAPEPQLPPDAAVLIVPDVLTALQDIAAAHRADFSGQVVGVTGSNGKTVVKEWLYHLVAAAESAVRSPKSYNSQLGVPLSVWLLEPQHRIGIFEAGISRPGEMQRLEGVIHPQIGIFTNIGAAHSEGFTSDAEKAAEKAKLFRYSDAVIYCRDHAVVHRALLHLQEERQESGETELKLLSWSATGTPDARWQVRDVNVEDGNTHAIITDGVSGTHLKIPFADPASFENAMHCWVALQALGLGHANPAEQFEQLQPVAMRLELRRGINNCTLLDDAYNSDLTALRIALDALGRQAQHQRHTVILSDLLQAGKPDAELYAGVARMLSGRGISRFIGIGPALTRHRSLFETAQQLECDFFNTTSEFLQELSSLRFSDEAILIKGARDFAFERIVAVLEAEVHRTVLSIDLSALTRNLAAFRALLRPQTKVMAMVKAFSYGSGSFEIASALAHAGVDYLAVAYPDEGIALRERGVQLPIMVMSPDVASFDRLIAWKLEPEIYSFRSLVAMEAAAESLGVFRYPIHIKLDTGMHRLGFGTGEISRLIEMLRRSGRLKVRSVFSHLAASEAPTLDAFTQKQAQIFRDGSAQISEALGVRPLRHLCNSAGIARHMDLHFEMVRLGIGIYGIDSSAALQGTLMQVARLRTTIAQIRTVPAGEGVGYGNRDAARGERRIATVCVGYADGYPRALGLGVAHMLVKGTPARTVGSICMDMCMLDVTDIPEAAEGDEVIVFGPELPLETLAAWSGTIPYEMMTGISQRVKRVYTNEG